MKITPMRLDHVAYRCKDAKETTEFYTKLLDMNLVAALTEDIVGSTKEYCPHIHIFFAMKDGSCVAFFVTPDEKPMGRDPNTPAWVQHLALQVGSREELLAAKARLEAAGLRFTGLSPDGLLPEIVEYEDHPWFIGVQYHPELKSRPFEPHPLFASFIKAATVQSRLV